MDPSAGQALEETTTIAPLGVPRLQGSLNWDRCSWGAEIPARIINKEDVLRQRSSSLHLMKNMVLNKTHSAANMEF